jgi:hypothetical protein
MIPKSGNKNVDIAISIAVIIVIIYALKKILAIIKDPIGGLTGSSENTQSANPENWVITEPSKLNYPKYQYEVWANALDTALTNVATEFWFGEDEQTVKDIMFSINSDADFEAIVKAYGTRGTLWNISFEGDLLSTIRKFTPELVNGFNDHYAGWGMKYRI